MVARSDFCTTLELTGGVLSILGPADWTRLLWSECLRLSQGSEYSSLRLLGREHVTRVLTSVSLLVFITSISVLV